MAMSSYMDDALGAVRPLQLILISNSILKLKRCQHFYIPKFLSFPECGGHEKKIKRKKLPTKLNVKKTTKSIFKD